LQGAAAAFGETRTPEPLLNSGADVNHSPLNMSGRRTAIQEAAGHEDILKLLLEMGADVADIPMPIHWAVINGDPELMERCRAHGADTNADDQMGRNPMHIAARNDKVENLKWLLRLNSGSINARDLNGSTPLHSAIEGGNIGAFRCLLMEGANVEIPDNKKRTPLKLALANNNMEMVNDLLVQGAPMNGIKAREWGSLLRENIKGGDEDEDDHVDPKADDQIIVISLENGRIKPMEVSPNDAINMVRDGYRQPCQRLLYGHTTPRFV
jgi:ankyrin repeat protein